MELIIINVLAAKKTKYWFQENVKLALINKITIILTVINAKKSVEKDRNCLIQFNAMMEIKFQETDVMKTAK